MSVTEHILEGYSIGKNSIMLFLNVEKVLDKLWGYCYFMNSSSGIFLTGLLSFYSFLMQQTFKVKVNNAASTAKLVCFGIPQGSVFGSVLFKTYLANLQV